MIELLAEDFKVFELIEKTREDIIKKDKEINVIDFGAGSPTSTRTKEEMYIGTVKK